MASSKPGNDLRYKMKTVHVGLGKRSYKILIESGLLERLPRLLSKFGVGKQVFLVANQTVFQMFGSGLFRALSEHDFQVQEILIPDGERHKNLETVEGVYSSLIGYQADRAASLIALGGGVTGDIVGFVAATFLRGIPYIQIPTTLVSQVDSSVGGKTGVNHRLGKNMIGAFCQPRLVVVDTKTLSTLPEREYRSGLYEVVKYGLIDDQDFFEFFDSRLEEVKNREEDVLKEIIQRCCQIKAKVVAQDETEQGLRRILNFGHTFGHALEVATNFKELTHGEAIGYGMLAATCLSVNEGHLGESCAKKIAKCIGRIGALPAIDSVPIQSLLDAMKQDKKRQGDQIIWVLLEEIGKTVFASDFNVAALTQAWEKAKLEAVS